VTTRTGTRARPKTVADLALLAAIIESCDDGILSADLDGVITSWNKAAERIYGYTAEEVIGRRFAPGTPAGRSGEAEQLLEGLRHELPMQRLETTRVRKDGSVIDVALTVFPVRDQEGKVIGGSAIVRDVTELNAARAALMAAELKSHEADGRVKADQEISRAKDEMVSLVSHELRTPLASIVGFAELLATRDLSEAQRKVYLGVMLREGRRLTDLVNDVLQLQRLENGTQDLNPAPVDLRSLIQRAAEKAGEDERRPIGMIVPEPLPLVLADSDAILQVLGNFLSNARKFSPVGGSIRVGARHNGDQIEVYIRDEGLGIPAEAMAKLFHKFYRIDSADRRLIKGSGLGLSINRKIIEAHGGTVGVRSDGPGKGSRFHFTLPIARESAKTGDVLIIEDDAAFARMLETEFAAHGLSWVRASDAETAEHLLEGQPPRALVVDLKLPGLRAEDFLARLRTTRNAKLPVVVVTVNHLSAAEIMALQAIGVSAVLPKEAGAPQAAVALIAQALRPSTPVAS
jgi:PAS domain S-box-containing protein